MGRQIRTKSEVADIFEDVFWDMFFLICLHKDNDIGAFDGWYDSSKQDLIGYTRTISKGLNTVRKMIIEDKYCRHDYEQIDKEIESKSVSTPLGTRDGDAFLYETHRCRRCSKTVREYKGKI